MRELKKIKLAWPELNYSLGKGVLVFGPSGMPAIPRNDPWTPFAPSKMCCHQCLAPGELKALVTADAALCVQSIVPTIVFGVYAGLCTWRFLRRRSEAAADECKALAIRSASRLFCKGERGEMMSNEGGSALSELSKGFATSRPVSL